MKQLRQAVPNLELQFKPCQADTISKISHTSSTVEGSELREEKTTYMGVQDKKREKYNTWCASTFNDAWGKNPPVHHIAINPNDSPPFPLIRSAQQDRTEIN